MSEYICYENELNMLLVNEQNIEFFCSTVSKELSENLQQAKKLIDYVIDFSNKHNLYDSKAWMLYYLGWYYSGLSLYENAIEAFNDSRSIFEKRDNKCGLAYSYNGLASIYCQNGQYELSNELGLLGVALARELKNDSILLTMLINIAITNMNNNSYESAKEILEYIKLNYDLKSVSLADEIVCLEAMAEVEINIGNAREAFLYLDKAINIISTASESIVESKIHRLFAQAYMKLGDYEKADDEFILSYNIADKNNSISEKCEALIAWAKLKLMKNDNLSLINCLEDALKASQALRLNRITKDIAEVLYKYYKNQEDFEKSLIYLELYMTINKEINSYGSKKLFAKLNISNNEKEENLYKLLYDKTELLSSVGEKIISKLDIDDMFMVIDDEINKLVRADFFGITTYDEEKDEIVVRTVENGAYKVMSPIKVKDHTAFSAYCIKNRKTIVLDNIVKEYKKYVKTINLKDRGTKHALSGIYIPLIVNDEVIGAMMVQNLIENSYDNNDVNNLKIIGNYVAIALKNAIEYQKMEQIAIYDSMTGFLTKQEIIKEGNNIKSEFSITRRSFCIMMLDLDNFKNINDKFGHLVGDKILKMVTQTISKLIRATDYIGRYGGDEFLLVCPDMTKSNAVKIAERIRRVVENTEYVVNDIAVKTTLSVGVFEFNRNDLSFMDGVGYADRTLYEAKKRMKNNVMAL